MKCPVCGNEMEEQHAIAVDDRVLRFPLECDAKWNACPKCDYSDLGLDEKRDAEYLKARRELVDRWIAYKMASFRDIERRCIDRKGALEIVGRERKSPAVQKQLLRRCLDDWTFNFSVSGRKYYLKKSVLQYARLGNGLWSLEKGLDGYAG